jgi:O-antigen ligase
MWLKTLSFMNDGPLIYGYGLGHFSFVFFNIVNFNGLRFDIAHNEYIQLLYNFGIIGVICVSYIVFRAIKKETEPLILAGMFAVGINSFGNFVFHLSPLVFIALSYFAIGLSKGVAYESYLER